MASWRWAAGVALPLWVLLVQRELRWVIDPKYLLPLAALVLVSFGFALLYRRSRAANRRILAANEALAKKVGALERANEELRALDQVRTQLFANVSHDLRIPLALILGPTERILEAPGTTRAVHRDLEIVVRNARTLLRQVNDVLDLSKLDAGRMKVDYSDVDLAELVRFVAGHFEVLASEKRVSFTLDADGELGAEVDREKVRRILLKLLSNAFEFAPEGGNVRVSLRNAGGHARIEVDDSGCRIPPGERDAIFERFPRVEGENARHPRGVGLGLALARELVAVHGGSIAVDDAPEGGARFVVSLPRWAPAGVAVRLVEGDRAAASEEAQHAVDELRHASPPGQYDEPPGIGARVLVEQVLADLLSLRVPTTVRGTSA